MKQLFALAVFLWANAVSAQDSIPGSADSLYRNLIMVHAEAGYTNFHAWQLNDVFVAGGGQRFPAITAVGVGFLISEDYDNFKYEWNCAFHYYIPFTNEAMIDGQTRKYRLHGWEFLSCKDGYDVLPNKLFDFSGGIGFYCGNLKLDCGALRYTNPFVAPMAKIDLRVNVWKISMGARVSGRFDLTAGIWKRKVPGMAPMPEYLFREMQGLIYIGWILYE